jgi:hypothetical protein
VTASQILARIEREYLDIEERVRTYRRTPRVATVAQILAVALALPLALSASTGPLLAQPAAAPVAQGAAAAVTWLRPGPAVTPAAPSAGVSGASATALVVPPFHPRDSAALAQAKREAGVAASGAGVPVVPVRLAGAPAASLPVETSFPVMSLEGQYQALGNNADQLVAPPDTQLAAGPTDLVEAINSSLSVWAKTGGNPLKVSDLNTFFPVPDGYSFTDPRVIYDSASGRWFVSGLSFNESPGTVSTGSSQTYLAVSASADPTGSWTPYTVTSNTSGTLYDQPKLGISGDQVVLSWNDYGSGGTTFSGEETWVLNKADLLAGSLGAAQRLLGPDMSRFGLAPAQPYSASDTIYLVYNNADGVNASENQGTPTLGVLLVSGVPGVGAGASYQEWDPGLLATTAPPSAAQPNGVAAISTDDDRILGAVWQNGILWASANDGCVPGGDSTTRACMRLIEVSTSGSAPTVLQDFDLGASGGYLYYPAVAVDPTGNAFVSFTSSSSSQDATAQGVGLAGGQASGLTALVTVQAGQATFDICASQADCGSGGPNNSNRWGDYSGATPDPSNPGMVWLTAEYAASGNGFFNGLDWGTATGEVTLNACPATPTPQPGPGLTGAHQIFLPVVFNNYTGGC